MIGSNDDEGFPFPTPISSAMPMDQQMSMSSLYPGSNTQPTGGPSYNFSMPQYSHGGHTGLGQIAEHLRRQGEDEDEILAYINPEEAMELHQRFGSDINPHTGLPQFGFFKKIKKALNPVRKILPIAGSVLGNYIKPGLGGILGGGLGGALGGKRALKGALKGAAIGGIQGYGLPALGKLAGRAGMPNLGRGLNQLGQSKLLSGAESLGQGLGLIPIASQALQGRSGNRGTPWDSSPIAQALSTIGQQQGEAGGMGSLLNYLLLGLAGAGMVGGRTTYGPSQAHAREPSLQEIMRSMRIEEPEAHHRENAPYVPPAAHMQVPDVYGRERGEGYQYPEFPRFAKGGVTETLQKQREEKAKKIAAIKEKEQQKLKSARAAHDQHVAKLKEEKEKKIEAKKATNAPIAIPKAAPVLPVALPKPPIVPAQAPVVSKAASPPVLPQPVAPAVLPKPSAAPIPPPKPVPSPKPISPPVSAAPEFQNILEPLRLLIEHGKQIAEGKVPQSLPTQQQSSVPQSPISQNVPPPAPQTQAQPQAPSQPNVPYVPPSQHMQVPNVYGSQRNEGYQYPQFPGRENEVSQYGEQGYQYPQFPGSENSSQQYNDEGYQYPQFPTFRTGGFIDGVSGGQDDDVPVDLPVNGYVIDATTVSSLGDGNTKAGVKRLDELKKTLSLPKKFAKGKNVRPVQKGTVKALVSPGEYYFTPEEVTSLGKGDNAQGAKKMKSMVQKIRRHKGFKGLPPKAKPITSYISK